MCGRFNLLATPDAVAGHFQLPKLPRFQPSYNIPPSRKILTIVMLEDQSLKAVNLQWGLVPSWAKDPHISQNLINARAETVAEKPAFRSAFQHRRCLIAATGFYEWQKLATGKQAFHIHRPEQELFAFAGLWEHWQQGPDSLYSCAIITTAADGIMQPIHDRKPVIVPVAHYRDWLANTATVSELQELLDNEAYAGMIATPVSNRVNNPRNDDAGCLQEDFSCLP